MPKASKRGSQKSSKNRSKKILIFDQFGGPFGVPNGARKAQIRAPKSDLASSRVLGGAPGVYFAPIFDHFWIYIEMILVCIFDLSQYVCLCM